MRKLPTLADALADLSACLDALRPYARDVVLCGGWAPFFYRHLFATAPGQPTTLVTYDIDCAIPACLPVRGPGTLATCLRDADFVAIRSRDCDPPVIRYQAKRWGDQTLDPIHIELLTPLRGSVLGRSGDDRGLPEVQPDVRAQALRYLDLLFHAPTTVDASQVPGIAVANGCPVRIPNPMSYLLQKVLASPSRQANKVGKDHATLYDVALLAQPRWPEMREMLGQIQSNAEWAQWVIQSRKLLDRAYADDSAIGPLAAEAVYEEHARELAISRKLIWATVRAFRRDVGW